MRSIPGDISTDAQPPLRIPLAHFLVGLGFLLVGGGFTLGIASGSSVEALAQPVFGRVAAAHLLLVGWVTVTILGAMVQFVPVWSGVPLYSHRLATLQLLFVGGGVAGFATGFSLARLDVVVPFALAMFVGFVLFCYNVGRTLLSARPWDVTEGHFALAVGFFFTAGLLGTTLAIDFVYPIYPPASLPAGLSDAFALSRGSVLDAHVTLAVLGGVLATVLGALFQLGPMFTQSQATPLDDRLQQVETVVYPPGVVVLAAGRLAGSEPIATVGGLGVAVGVAAGFLFLARRLYTATVDYSPMLPRYGAVAILGGGWAISAAASWSVAPIGASVRLGSQTLGPILLFGAIGFVVVGTLYHVIPFLIWVHRYSDRLGYEPVPMVDELYDARLARFDLAATGLGTATLAVGAVLFVPLSTAVGGWLVFLGVLAFGTNMFVTVLRHAPDAADPRGWLAEA